MIDKNVTPTDLPAFLKSQELVPALYMYRGTSLIRNSPPPLGTLYGPRHLLL